MAQLTGEFDSHVSDIDDFGDFDQPESGTVEVLYPIEESSRRMFPHPETGKPTWFTRATQFAGTTSDEYTLTEWKVAYASMGTAKNRDLYALAESLPLPEGHIEDWPSGWWRPWADIGHQGMDRMGAHNGAHLGTAFHRWGEQIDRGTLDPQDMPEEWRAHGEAFVRVHEAEGMRTRPEFLERFIWNPLDRGLCGRTDSLRELPDGSLVVDDTKTGKNAPAGLDEIAIQLAIYANSPWLWDMERQMWVQAPANVRKDIATVTWIPINAPEKSEVIKVDIAVGWEAAKATAWVREYQRRAKRKNNGLRLDNAALTASIGQPVRKYTHDQIVSRIEACGSPDMVRNFFAELAAVRDVPALIQNLMWTRIAELEN